MGEQDLVYDLKLSSIGPGKVAGFNTEVEPGNIDLAMKLHFVWLNKFPVHNGRFRRDDSGRPYIKCNDCGVRFVELKCRKTLEEWLEARDLEEKEKLLVSGQVIGPELQFSPSVYVQLTKFEGGGAAVGVSWAHVLGDAFAMVDFVNLWGKTVAGLDIGPPVDLANYSAPLKSNGLRPNGESLKDPLSVLRVDPVGDHWIHSPEGKLELFSFDISAAELSTLRSRLRAKGEFEAISAVIWQCVAKIRGAGTEPKVVTVLRKGSRDVDGDGEIYLRNTQTVGVVRGPESVIEADRSELAALLQDAVDEREKIESAMERSQGLADFVVYGANLSFLDLGEADLYGFEYNREKPVRVSYRIDGVGANGAILVLQGRGGDGGRSVTAILPEKEVAQLKSELVAEGIVAA